MKNYVTHYCPVLPFYTPFKTSEHDWFSNVFWWYKKATLGSNGVKITA